MLSLLFFLACKTESIPETTDAPQITSSVQGDPTAGENPPDNPMAHNQNQPPLSMDPNNGDPEANIGETSGGQQEPKKKPPTFIFNAQSDDSGPLYKAEDGTCFVRKNWDSPPNGTLGDTEARDCPQQMASDAWNSCVNGRLVKHNVGDKEGTCECEPITGGEAVVINCP